MKKEEQPELEPYTVRGGFWKPTGRLSHKAVKDTAESLLSMQEVKPAKKRVVNEETLSPQQKARELAFKQGGWAFERGKARDSSPVHRVSRESRTALEDIELAAFELGWDTAERAARSE